MNKKFILVQWPESQFLMESPRFSECLFVQDLDGHDEVGSSAFMAPEDLYEDLFNPYIAVDLGLPSGLKWADRNLGASKDTEAGRYFSWGNTRGYYANEPHDFSEKKDYEDGFLEPYASTKGATLGDNNIPVDPKFDAARFNMGGSWRMPTREDFQELYDNCTWTWTSKNGINGYLVSSKVNSNSIFLPASGRRRGDSIFHAGSYGGYWSSSYNSFNLGFSSSSVYSDDSDYRFYGLSVRGVTK